MNTFLPYPDFKKSAEVLDRRRLGKQRVEVLQLLKALLVPGSGWANHPAARMWRGHEGALADYGFAVCEEWTGRGYTDNCCGKIMELLEQGTFRYKKQCYMPSWFGDPAFHASHRSNLLRKDPLWYGQFGWSEPPDLPYVWPV